LHNNGSPVAATQLAIPPFIRSLVPGVLPAFSGFVKKMSA